MSDSERWSRVSEILSQVLDLPESDRGAFLQEAIRQEPSLRTEVMSLFDDLSGIEGFMETPAFPLARTVESFGPYRVLGELGEGGMGIVYLAERSDGQFARRVAIKRIGSVAPDADLLRRFADERQILAGLDHPNIARLLDAGIDEAGIPYLVMEHVEGIPIGAFCRTREVALRARLKLFLKVCAAVEHAHRNLVIHRDIKPANILVTPEEEPKLLDFGIAKVLSRVDPGNATRTVHRALTVDFASPEQMRGEPVNTASDLYSLGVVLFELLADAKPYECGGRSFSEAVRMVCDFTPRAPSQVAPAERRAALQGDLDAIVRKALEKSPQDRYASVAELADDVRAHLEHRPVRARHASLAYRARKLARRHRVGVAVGVSALAFLAAGVAAVLWQAHVAERERRRAEARFEDVRRLANSVIYELHDAIANLPGATGARRLLVARALEYLDRLAGEARDDLDLQRELADAYQRIAQVQNSGLGANLGDTEAAFENYGKALSIRRSLAAATSAESQDLVGLALLEFELGTLHRATGKLADAERFLLSAASRLEALDRARALPDPRRRLAGVYQRLAELQTFQGRREAAVRWAEKARAEAESGWRADPANGLLRSGLAAASHELAEALANQGRYAEALERSRSARALLERRPGEIPLDAQQTRILLFVLHGEGRYLTSLGDLPGALRVRQRAFAIAEETWRSDPRDRWSQMALAVATSALGDTLLESGSARESARRFRGAHRIAEKALAEDPEYEFARFEAASAEYGLGRALLTLGGPDHLAEGCSILHRVRAFWSELRLQGELPAGETEELDRLSGWLARCDPDS